MRILFMNSGGKDSRLALAKIVEDNPTAEVVCLTIEVADQKTMADTKILADKYGLKHVVLPFEGTRQHIRSKYNPDGASAFWSFEVHFKGIQYARANGFDCVVSGHDATSMYGDIEELLNRIMDMHKNGERVAIHRPLRNVKNMDDYEAIKATLKNPMR